MSGGDPVSPLAGYLPQISVTDTHNTTPTDTRLTEWLQGLGVDAPSIDRVSVSLAIKKTCICRNFCFEFGIPNKVG